MCWISRINNIIRVAEEDIECFKIVRLNSGKILSYFQEFEYSIDSLYSIKTSLKIYKKDYFGYVITEGFHSYSKSSNINPKASLGFFIVTSYRNAILEYYSKEIALIAKCIIPKGSEFIMNEDGEIVSTSIIIKKIEELEF